MSRRAHMGFDGKLRHYCDNCGNACERYQKDCPECGAQLTDIVERTLGPILDDIALKHHDMLPECADDFEEP